MTDYTKNTNFGAKDALASGHGDKVILGVEMDGEFDEIAIASATKENLVAKNVADGYCPLDSSVLVPSANLPAATETVVGALETATDAEALAGSATDKIVVPSNLASMASTETYAGLVELATNAEVTAGTDTARAVTAAGLEQKVATQTALGIIGRATGAEVLAGTDDELAITPLTLLSQRESSTTQTGVIELATDAEALTATDALKALTPASAAAQTQYISRKNLLLNGMMQVAERGNTFTGLTSNQRTWDMWKTGTLTTTAVLDWGYSSISTSGTHQRYKAEIEATTADATLGVADKMSIVHGVEGLNMRHLNWGTLSAKDITLSFYHAHTKTGIYSVAIRNASSNRTYVAEYTQSVESAEEEAVITIPGMNDITASWDTGAVLGMEVRFTLGAGSDIHTATLDTWNNDALYSSPNQVNFADTINNKFRLSGVQLEVGGNKTEPEMLTIGERLRDCQRYYYKVNSRASGVGYFSSSTNCRAIFLTPVTMRTTPSMSCTTSDIRCRGNGNSFTPTGKTVSSVYGQGIHVTLTVSGAAGSYAASIENNASNCEFKAEI